ncbi:MAG: methylated-DNA--[protein]-cysteine S-methyltransferase [Cytophagales bacterium]
MESTEEINYQKITKAIEFLTTHFKSQPSLEQIAEHVHLSPFHFQRLFTNWAGTSPKKFLQYISVEHAKQLLLTHKSSVIQTAYDTGFSGSSRLHDLFVNIEGMTPAEYKNGGKNLRINYSFSSTPFGKIMVASTPKGICSMVFVTEELLALENLKENFPHASFHPTVDALHNQALQIFKLDWNHLPQIKLHLKGTDFQLKIWETLLKIPMGQLSTYGEIAENIGHKKAARAVGTAIGSNPVAFLIPCHRVIQASGKLGGYMWGNTRKTAIIGWENAKIHQQMNLEKNTHEII